jgi:K+-transporting ATPase c subunit
MVNGVAGGSASAGTISSSGLYTAPAVVPAAATVQVSAVSQADNTKTAIAPVTIAHLQIGHVFLLVEENHSYSNVIGSSAMPYLNGLAEQYGLATNY